VAENYARFAESMLNGYLTGLGGKESFFFRALNKILGNRLRRWKQAKRYTKKQRLALRNIIECEAHRELLLEGLTDRKP
jgi:poly-gamma-glutamate synthesis protein (capsule biosynthesis protein)